MSTVTGKIVFISEESIYGDSGFRKRELVVKTEGEYPQDILIEFVQDKCDILNKYSEGQIVEVGYNLRGRKWVNPEGVAKYFNSIQGWRIEKSEVENIPVSAETVTAPAPDDLPFN